MNLQLLSLSRSELLDVLDLMFNALYHYPNRRVGRDKALHIRCSSLSSQLLALPALPAPIIIGAFGDAFKGLLIKPIALAVRYITVASAAFP